jgi:hypothetical protein
MSALLFGVTLITGCLFWKREPRPQGVRAEGPPAAEYLVPESEPDDNVREAVRRLDYVRFKEHIHELSKFVPGTGAVSMQVGQGVEWVYAHFENLGYKVGRDTFTVGDVGLGNLFVTKVGTRFPHQMYIVSGSIGGFGRQGADNNASGAAVVLEMARVLASPDVRLDRSIRLMIFNSAGRPRAARNIESGPLGSSTYANTLYRKQGLRYPETSGIEEEPLWLGIINHDMVLFDHGFPAATNQAANADIDIEYHYRGRQAAASAALAQVWARANLLYAERYPVEIGDRLEGTDAYSFRDYVASINVSENQRREIIRGSNPRTRYDYDTEYSEEDFQFGFNVLRTSMAGVAYLAGLRIAVD